MMTNCNASKVFHFGGSGRTFLAFMFALMMTHTALPRFCFAAITLSATMTLGLAVAVEPGAIAESDETFKSRGKDVIVDLFAPSAPASTPL